MIRSTDSRRRHCLIGLGLLALSFLTLVGTARPAWEWYHLERLK